MIWTGETLSVICWMCRLSGDKKTKIKSHQHCEVHTKSATEHTPCIPEHDPSILLARRAEKLWVSWVPRNVINLIAMRAGEQGCRSRLHLGFVEVSVSRQKWAGPVYHTHALLRLKHPHHPIDPYCGQLLSIAAPRNVCDWLRRRDTNVTRPKSGESRCLRGRPLSWLHLSKVDGDTRRT